MSKLLSGFLAASFLISSSAAWAFGSRHSQVKDSFSKECPKLAYSPVFSDSDGFATVKASIESQLKAMGLGANWGDFLSLGASWNSFSPTDPGDLAKLKRLASIVLPALKKYPIDWFKIVDLRRVTLVKDLNVGGQLRKAMPDPGNSTVFYAENGDLICDAGMEERVHHEFYHYIENHFHGDMYYHDPDYMKFNPPGFQYGTGGSNAYNIPDWQNLGHPSDALVSLYAGFASEEDKPEVFGFMMAEGYAARLKGWVVSDSGLAQKRAFLISFFSKSSSGEMGDAYFETFAH